MNRTPRLAILLTAGCGLSDRSISSSQIDDIEARLSALEEENATLQDQVAACATQTWVADQDYLPSDALTGYATEDWVTGQGYASESWVEAKGYLTSDALAGYATESWVEGQGYLTSDALTGYATEDWVVEQGYLTSVDLGPYAQTDWITANYYDSATSDARYASLSDFESLETSAIRLLTTTTTYEISSAEDLRTKLSELDNYRIASGAYVGLHLAADTYTFDEPLRIEHPDGARIAILGDLDAPEGTVLHFNSDYGIELLDNQSLGYLGGLTLEGPGGGSGAGLIVDGASQVEVGALITTGWYVGIVVDHGSSLKTGDNGLRSIPWGDRGTSGEWAVETTGNGWGARIQTGSTWDASYAWVHDNTSYGFYVFDGSTAWASNSVFEGQGEKGASVEAGSTFYARDATFSNNGDDGLGCFEGSTCDVVDSEFYENGFNGVRAYLAGVVYGYNISTHDNASNGMSIEVGSAAVFDYGQARSNGGNGVTLTESAITANYSVSNDNAGHGFYAGAGSVIDAGGGGIEAGDNASGVVSYWSSLISAPGSNLSGNSADAVAYYGGQLDLAGASLTTSLLDSSSYSYLYGP